MSAVTRSAKSEVRERIKQHEIIKIIDSNLILTNVENTGAAMSMGSDFPPFLKLILLQLFPIVLMIGLIGYLILNRNAPKIHQIAIACIIGGGIGNIFDRIRYNSVTDFVFIEIGPLRTGIFNMADLSIFLGMTIVLFTALANRNVEQIEGSV